jgi:PAS domain S-box-containing protein
MSDEKGKLIKEINNLSLLFVDDNSSIRNFAKNFFSKYFKKIDIAKNGKEALEFLKENRYDILITDLNMPDMDGFELIKVVKNKYADLYIIVLSAFFDTDTLLKAIYLGVDGFLVKPFKEIDFLNIMKKILTERIKYEKEIGILKQYKEIVDENLIISKTDKRGIITYVNDSFEKISGFTKEELLGKPHNIVRHPDMKKEVFRNLWKTILSKKTWRGIVKNRKKNGEPYYVDTVIKPILDSDGNIKEFIALRKDITDMMSAEKLIEDKLKIIKKAVLLLNLIENYYDLTLIYDEDTLNKIKIRLLKKIKLLIKEEMKIKKEEIEEYFVKDDILGFLIERGEIEDFEKKLENILKKVLNIPIVINGVEYYPLIKMSFSSGKEHLYQNAILGIEKIKNSEERIINSNGLCAKRKIEIIKNMEIVKTIEYALKNDGVISLFQPIVDNKKGKIVKYESLVRIRNAKGELLTPGIFLEVSKKAGLYTHIASKIIDNTFQTMKEKNIAVSINLAPGDVLRDSIRTKILECLKKCSPEKGMITFELLEDEIIKYPKTMHEFIDEVLSLNADIAIDDFGRGYSNFTRIVELKANIIKIDGSLIKNIDKDKVKKDAVEAIVKFAKKENKITVAEYVENKNIYDTLRKLEVDFSQGYYFSKPLFKEDIKN